MKEGYLLEVETWENDGDHYQTLRLDGLTKEDVEFYIEILSQFGSKYGSRNVECGQHGNSEIDFEELLRVVKQSLINHPGISQSIKDRYQIDFEMDEDGCFADEILDDVAVAKANEIFDELAEVLGNTVDYEDYTLFIRVVEEIKVHYVECKLRDVTDKFKVKK